MSRFSRANCGRKIVGKVVECRGLLKAIQICRREPPRATQSPWAWAGRRAGGQGPTAAEPGPARDAGPTLGPSELINVRSLTGQARAAFLRFPGARLQVQHTREGAVPTCHYSILTNFSTTTTTTIQTPWPTPRFSQFFYMCSV